MKNKKNMSTIYIISAASGTGKTSLRKALVSSMEDIELSISHTTRLPRPNEKEGVDFYFISEEEFEKMIAEDAFVEHAEVFGNYYGTSRVEIQRLLKSGVDIILEIDVQGSEQVCKIIKDTVSIFILPPSQDALERRILSRKQNAKVDIKKRLAEAKKEIARCNEYDFLVVNDVFDEALNELRSIIQSKREGEIKVQEKRYESLIRNLTEM